MKPAFTVPFVGLLVLAAASSSAAGHGDAPIDAPAVGVAAGPTAFVGDGEAVEGACGAFQALVHYEVRVTGARTAGGWSLLALAMPEWCLSQRRVDVGSSPGWTPETGGCFHGASATICLVDPQPVEGGVRYALTWTDTGRLAGDVTLTLF